MPRHPLVQVLRPWLHPLLAVLVASPAFAAGVPPAPCKPKIEKVGGGTWEARPVDEIGAPAFSQIAADEHDPRFVVVVDPAGVLVTHDGGCTWKRVARDVDLMPPFGAIPVDVTVAGTGHARSVHVLAQDAVLSAAYSQPVLLSSWDDGATWETTDAPPLSGSVLDVPYALASTVRSSETLYLHSSSWPVSGIYAKTASGWRWLAAGTWAQPEACVPGGPCPSRVMRTLYADPRRDGALWGIVADPNGEAVARSTDEGASWEYRSVPELVGGIGEDEVTPGGAILLLGTFRDYGFSGDGGRSWSVGDLPQLSSASDASRGVSGAAHFDRGRAFAVTLGYEDTSRWAGNVLVFDGREWTDVSPAAFAGYDRTDEEGRRRTFVELLSTRGPLVALTSTGDLMTYRR